eukprot:m.174048 g.174048  ORF g.174048 m.174048 type:complete len:250 (-) comp13775_c0_seq1:146-895(-)
MAPSLFTANNRRASTSSNMTELYFEAKYYGPCPEISSEGESPDLDNVLDIMASRKRNSLVLRINLCFSESGAVVTERKNKMTVASWRTTNMASCATILHPTNKSRRIGLLKIRNPETGELKWHLFKYCFGKVDNMSDCFRFVVDCGLRDIGRAYANVLASSHEQPSSNLPTARMPARNVPSAWSEPTAAPPAYDEPTEAELELADLRRSSDARLSFDSDNSDTGAESSGYMDLDVGVSEAGYLMVPAYH